VVRPEKSCLGAVYQKMRARAAGARASTADSAVSVVAAARAAAGRGGRGIPPTRGGGGKGAAAKPPAGASEGRRSQTAGRYRVPGAGGDGEQCRRQRGAARAAGRGVIGGHLGE